MYSNIHEGSIWQFKEYLDWNECDIDRREDEHLTQPKCLKANLPIPYFLWSENKKEVEMKANGILIGLLVTSHVVLSGRTKWFYCLP